MISKITFLTGLMVFLVSTGYSSDNKEYLFDGEKYSISQLNNDLGSYLVDRKECANKRCGKAIFFLAEKWHGANVYIIDFDKKEWTLGYVRTKTNTKGKYYNLEPFFNYRVFKHVSIENKYNLKDLKDDDNYKNIYYLIDHIHTQVSRWDYTTINFFTEFFSTPKNIGKYETRAAMYTFNKHELEEQGYKFKKNLGFLSTSNKNKTTGYIQSFIETNQLNDIVKDFNKDWSHTNESTGGITGEGEISFSDNDRRYFIIIEGKFKNGVLISNGSITIRRAYEDGGIHFIQPFMTEEKKINPSTNLRQTILKMNQSLDAKISYETSEKQNYSSSTSSGTKTFTCSYSCLSDVGLLYETIHNVGSIQVSANSSADAKMKADDIVTKRCAKTLNKDGYKMRGGSADCEIP